jgi:hypothetical protein
MSSAKRALFEEMEEEIYLIYGSLMGPKQIRGAEGSMLGHLQTFFFMPTFY